MPSSRFTRRYGPILGDFQNFSAGEWGAIGARRAGPGQFSGTNVVVYLDGSIGPRHGLRDITPSPSTFDLVHSQPNGLIDIGLERNGNFTLWAVDNDGRVWQGGYIAMVQWTHFDDQIALFGTPGFFILGQVDDGHFTYLSSAGQESYKLNHEARTVIALPGSTGGRSIAIFGDRMVAGGGTTGNQIFFSDANNYLSWPALNFVGIGGADAVIESLEVQRNILIVTMRDGSIYTVSGTLGVNEVVRQFTSTTPRTNTVNPHRIALTKRGLMWRRGRDSVPESFDGTQLRSLTALNNWIVDDPETGDIAITAGPDDDDIVIFGGHGAMLLLHNGVWTKHRLGIVDNSNGQAADAGLVACSYDGVDAVILATQQVGGHVSIYQMPVAMERPAMVALGDTVVDPSTGLAPDAGFTLPEIRDSAGRLMACRAVGVRFTKYDTGNAQTNHFRVSLETPDAFELEQPNDIPPIEWEEDPALATTTGVRELHQFGFDAGLDRSAVSVTIDQIRGVKIDEVVVYGTIEVERAI